jgi:hypothetical protein
MIKYIPLPNIADLIIIFLFYLFSFSHGLLAKQGDVGMVPHLVMRRPPLKIGEVAETKIRPGFR